MCNRSYLASVVVIWLNVLTGFNDGAVEVHSLGDSIYRNICFVQLSVSGGGSKQLFLLQDRGCLSGGVFLYLGEGTSHANRVGIPRDSTSSNISSSVKRFSEVFRPEIRANKL